ncbi:MAG TPA: cytochrome b/b6 domain-containing protein [Caulobacteraceae bacterium]|nr:cytochrome b/b6 domain-containing protein [Caulobacteraceae bacterium]
MRLSNTREGYGLVAVGLHWISAIGVIWLYLVGDRAGEAPTRAEHVAGIAQHVSIGLLFIAFLAARLIWTATQPHPKKLETNRPLQILASAVQGLFLAMIAVQIVTGPLVMWAAAKPLNVFDWVSIPSPFPARVGWLREGAEAVHKLAPKMLWPLLGLHVLGALKHVIIDRDRTLLRMIKPV